MEIDIKKRFFNVGGRKLRLAVLAAFVCGQGLALAETNALSLAQVLDAARNNFDIAQARGAVAAARADIVAADRPPFPILSVKLSSIDLQNGVGAGDWLRAKRVDKGVGIDWAWERGDKRALRTQVAQRAADAVQADMEENVVQQLLAASNAFYDLAAAQERESNVTSSATGTALIAEIAARRVRAGDLAHQDELRLEIEAERAKGEVVTAKLDRKRAMLILGSLMGLTTLPVSLRAQVKWPQPGDTTAKAEFTEAAMQDFVNARSDLRAAAERVAAARSALDSASAQKKADVTWGVSLDHFPGTSTRLLELRMQMPLQFGYEYQGEIGRAQGQLEAAEFALEKARHAARADFLGLLAQLQSSAERSQSFEQAILPRAREVASQAEFAYAKGALALNDLLDARRTLRLVSLDALTTQAEYAKAIVALRIRTRPAFSLTND